MSRYRQQFSSDGVIHLFRVILNGLTEFGTITCGSLYNINSLNFSDISYTNLPAGDYAFHLAVLNSKGKYKVAESAYKVIKEKEIYDYWWFMVYVIAVR